MTRAPLAAAALAAAVAVPSDAARPFTAAERRAAVQDPAAYTLDESSLRIEPLGEAPLPAPSPVAGAAGGALPALDLILNTGAKLWKIVEENRPVVNVRTSYATALPRGVETPGRLEGWSAPRGSVYRLSAKNVYGVTVIELKYQVLRVSGGAYRGRGKYLTAVAIEPLLVEAAWGYELTVEAEVPDSSVVNVGTSESPVAAMAPQLRWRVRTPLKHSEGRALYYVQGDGLFRELGGPFERGYEEPVARALRGALEYGP